MTTTEAPWRIIDVPVGRLGENQTRKFKKLPDGRTMNPTPDEMKIFEHVEFLETTITRLREELIAAEQAKGKKK